jgi:peptidoglycan biosynthesis protein MviN/MurJ (putative lipid II flippase)
MRGNFTSDDVSLAASVQALHSWHVVPYILSIVAVRALAAIAETWVLLVGAIANLTTDLLVNVFMVPTMGVVAVGFASTAMYTVSALVLSLGFLWRLRRMMAGNR